MLSSFKHELKAQGAVEAARNPDSNVTAEDAEKVMIEESRKAGATALHFSADATPEEKAAQAREVNTMRPACNVFGTDHWSQADQATHHIHRPKGIGVVTDLVRHGDPQ